MVRISIKSLLLATSLLIVGTAVHSCVVSNDAGKNEEWGDFDRRADAQRDYRDRVRKK